MVDRVIYEKSESDFMQFCVVNIKYERVKVICTHAVLVRTRSTVYFLFAEEAHVPELLLASLDLPNITWSGQPCVVAVCCVSAAHSSTRRMRVRFRTAFSTPCHDPHGIRNSNGNIVPHAKIVGASRRDPYATHEREC